MEINSDFEKEIFANVDIFTTHFDSIDLNQKNILEIIGIAFYGSKYIANAELQLNNYNFDKYIKLCIEYYSNFIVKERSSTKNEVNTLVNEMNQYFEQEKEKSNMSYIALLHRMTTFVKNKYMVNKNEYLYISNPLYRYSFIQRYNMIDCLKYVQFIIINEYFDDMCSIISLSNYSHFISKEDINTIKNDCINENSESTFLCKIHQKIGTQNVSYTDFIEFIENILKNGIKTPYYYESKYKDFFGNLLNTFSTKIDLILKPEDAPLFDLIKNIKQRIVNKGIDSNESIDIEYPNICISEIVNNKLNINEFATKTFYEYFMTSKSEAKLALQKNKVIKK